VRLAGNELSLRVASAAFLAVFALAGAWFGGWTAGLVVAIVVAVIHVEWTGVTRDTSPYRHIWTAGLVAGILAFTAGYGLVGLGLAAVAAVAAGLVSRAVWPPGGVVYAAALGFGLLFIRLSPNDGRAAIFFLLAVVWATDTAAYFVGRAMGGPKLWPAISPNKTWSGAIGGFVVGMAAGIVVALLFSIPLSVPLVLVAALLAVAAELGDLFESSVKRRFGAKDASQLVPGHGGLMDRADGQVFAASLAALIGWLHAGGGDLAAGLLRW
jgi:phosphatidate cytidylyltransferase